MDIFENVTDEDLCCRTYKYIEINYNVTEYEIIRELKRRGLPAKREIINNIKLLITDEEWRNLSPYELSKKYKLSVKGIYNWRKERLK